MAVKPSTKKTPSIGGENPTRNYKMSVSLLGSAYVLNRHIPSCMPQNEHELRPWLDQYINTARVYRATFPKVFDGGGVYTYTLLEPLRDRLNDAYRSLDYLPGTIRSITAWKNIIWFNKNHDAIPAPLQENYLVPTTSAPASGLVGIIDAQVKLLRTQPGYNEAIGRQFGIIPTEGPAADPASYDPGAKAKFTGGDVIITARSPQNLKGVELLQVRCDRGNGKVELVGVTTHSKYTDHHELPAKPTLWIYYVNYLDRDGIPVGHQSIAEVTVSAMS